MTGDIVLFHGLGWESRIIRIIELSPWTHVAMLVRIPEIDYPLIWESFPFKFIDDVILHRRKSGARLVPLDERLAVGIEKGLFDRVAVRRLKAERTPEMMAELKGFILGRIHDLPYPSDWEMLIDFLRHRLFVEKKGRSDEIHCAELVADTYKCMHLLSQDKPSDSFLPKDFSSQGPHLSLLRDAELEEERILILGKNQSPYER